MIKIEKTEVVGWEHAIRGMRNPLNSWDKSDSVFSCDGACSECEDNRIEGACRPVIGDNDLSLMKRLAKAGTDHRKYLRMITVYADITAPLYWWKEYDTYKVGTVANSCSTMHKIADKKFELDDFSTEHLLTCGEDDSIAVDFSPYGNEPNLFSPEGYLSMLIIILNKCRNKYLETNDKVYWWQLIQLLPSSYNQKRTAMLNYEVLSNVYKSRKNHKLDEWREFCSWIETLPYAELITGGVDE